MYLGLSYERRKYSLDCIISVLMRGRAYNDMCYLVDKYAPFGEGEGLPRTIVHGEVDPSIPDGFNIKPWGGS